MRRADRLFQIVQLLRTRGLTTADQLASELEVSARTIYRDVRDLCSSGVPIEGEAGVGYLLPERFDLPPLMFTADEISAAVLGARMVQSHADSALREAAGSMLRKIEAALPASLAERVLDTTFLAPDFHLEERVRRDLGPLRRAIEGRRKIRLEYSDAQGEATERILRPLGLVYWGSSWSLSSWCELRGDFRNFRIDRFVAFELLDEGFAHESGKTLEDYLSRVRDC